MDATPRRRATALLLWLTLIFGDDVAGAEPVGRLRLVSLFVSEFLQTPTSETAYFMLTCHTPTRVARMEVSYTTSFSEVEILRGDHDVHMELLPHETVQCELTEGVVDADRDNSHGNCELTYARFLAPQNNTVTCHLIDGSTYALRMDCDGGCPAPEAPAKTAYCQRRKEVLPVDVGLSHSLTDGSPGFALYAPNTLCAWIVPRLRVGATNFLFSRLDLGRGDVLSAYASPDGKRWRLLRRYDEASVPESVSTSAKYLILELQTDGDDEGLGFAGFYYYTNELLPPVAITTQPQEERPASAPAVTGRRFD